MIFSKRPGFREVTIHVAAWWRGYFCFYGVEDSRGEQINHTGRATGQDRLVESRHNPRDYSLAALSVGSWRRFSHLSVGCKLTSEADLDVVLVLIVV